MLTDIQDPKERELAKRLCWKVGVLDYRRRNTQVYIQQQTELAKLRSRKVYWEMTRRLGKSSELLQMFDEHCRKYPGWQAGYFAPVKEGLEDYIEPIITRTFEDCPEEDRPRLVGLQLEYPNGSRIIFRGANNKQHRNRRGLSLNETGIDEARAVDDLSELIDGVIMPAMYDTNGYLYISSTPADTRSHPLFHYRQLAEVEGWLVRLTIWQAHALDPLVYPLDRTLEWKAETLKGIDGIDVWNREYECEWVINKSRAAVPEWKPAYIGKVVRDPFYRFYHHYIAIDWGYKDFTAVLFGTYLFRSTQLALESELAYSGTDVRSDKLADAIGRQAQKLWGEDWARASMWSDSADPILINELNKYEGMNFQAVHKANTLEAMMNQFRVRVGTGGLLVSPECQLTLHGLANGVWDEKRKKLDQDAMARHFDHLMAAVYMERSIDTATNPIPPEFMIDGVKVINLNFDKEPHKSSDAKALEGAFGGAQRRF